MEFWALLRAADGEEEEKVNEAFGCAYDMREYGEEEESTGHK